MKKIEQTKIDKIKRAVKRSPLFVAKYVVQVSLCLLILVLIIGAIFFYKCNILSVKKGLESLDNSCPLNESNYNKVLEVWKNDNLKLEDVDSRVYDDVFSRERID